MLGKSTSNANSAKQPHAEQSFGEPLNGQLHDKAGKWAIGLKMHTKCLHSCEVGKRVTTLCRKSFTQRSSLRSELRTLGIPVDDDATVDVLGMCLYAFL